MDFNALLEPAIQFSSDGIGAALLPVAEGLYAIFFPANAEAATTN
ncbi:MAG: hypothetical protein SOW59_02645 [Corynebacterium sp.]|nr:hypothetical protein [Corynebacterium sp.]